ncbi:MAG TPA: HAMP domain-containing sensor histidine kinase [Candidatus Dormibacteraeota bacterium]|nr:HAMP domain-containing sensor histidine kinase [Candidatus Dormibacteraeota bacterium]
MKWRVAASYAAVFVALMIAVSAIVGIRLQAILYAQALSRVNATMSEIASAVHSANDPFSLGLGNSDAYALLIDGNNLSSWSSPTSFVQIDSGSGYPLAKSSNLGGTTIPKATSVNAAHAIAVREVTLPIGTLLVEDRYFALGDHNAIVHVAEPLDALERSLAQAREAIVLAVVAAIVAILALSLWLAVQAFTPLEALATAMREIGSERLDRRLQWRKRDDEIGRLAESFDDLLARLQEAFARERQFISDASHELKTPLTSINANAQMLLRWGDREPAILHESLETIAFESTLLSKMVGGMLLLAKADRGDAIPTEPLSLGALAGEAVTSARPLAAAKALELRLHAEGGIFVDGEANLLRQAISNLIENAIKFTAEGFVEVRVAAEGERAIIEVSDSGPGIPREQRTRIFERFYRVDSAHARDVPGTGLGLAIVRSIARVHGGSVEAGDAAGGGARLRISLPRLPENLTEPS